MPSPSEPGAAVPERKGLFLVYFAVAVGLLGSGYAFRGELKSLLASLEGVVDLLGPAAAPAMLVVCGLWGTLCLPGPLMQGTVGAIFSADPLVALAVVLGGESLAQACAFALARFLARDRIRGKLQDQPWFGKLESETAKKGPAGVFFFRLMPFFPNALGSYAFGLTSIRFWPYITASVVGSIPKMVVYVYGTTSVARLFHEGRVTSSDILMVVGVIALVTGGGRALQLWLRRRSSPERAV